MRVQKYEKLSNQANKQTMHLLLVQIFAIRVKLQSCILMTRMPVWVECFCMY